jgi:hypothetical protein
VNPDIDFIILNNGGVFILIDGWALDIDELVKDSD